MSLEVIVPEVSDGVKSGTVISILVAVGDKVEEDQSLIEFETDKAVVAIPSPKAGVIKELKVSEGDTAEVGAVIAILDLLGSGTVPEAAAPSAQTSPLSPAAEVPAEKGEEEVRVVTTPLADADAEMVVIGAGPGGYAAAFKAVEMG